MPPWDGRPLSALESSAMEENAVALGISLDRLMENAGRAVAEEVARHLPAPSAPVAIVAGTGNNGGDGFSAAYYLAQWGFAPEIWLARPSAEIRSRPARRCFERVERRARVHEEPPTAEALGGVPLIVDALLGTGQSGPLRPPYRTSVDAIVASAVPVLSIDLPTGVGTAGAVRPRWTVALTARKEGMDPESCGEIVVRDIGIPAEAWRRTGPGEFVFYRARSMAKDRGRDGRVVVVGGGPYAGAPGLAGLAALRTGAERATVISPRGAAEAVQAFGPDLVVRSIGTSAFAPEDTGPILAFLREARPRAVVLGMGVGRTAPTLAAMEALIRGIPPEIPTVVDADALGALGEPIARGRTVLATPNAGEFARVFQGRAGAPLSEALETARSIASGRGISLLVKGEPDLLAHEADAFQNFHHHIAQTVSGVGDIVAGVLGSLLAQGLSAPHAMRLASYWVGDAGIRAAGRKGMGLIASDVLDELPSSLVAGLDRIARLG